VSVTLELFVPDTEVVPVRDVVEEGVVVVEEDADFVAEDVGLPDEEIVDDLVVVIVPEGVLEAVDDLEIVGEEVDVTEGTEVLVTEAVADDVCVLIEVVLTELEALVVNDGIPVLVSVEVTVDVAVFAGEFDEVVVPLLVFEVEEVTEDVAEDVIEGDVVQVDVPEGVGLLVRVMLGEPDAVIEEVAVALMDVDPVDVFDVVPELLDDLVADDDLEEEGVGNPVGRAVLVFDTLGDPVVL
jgi:hypothetical protein